MSDNQNDKIDNSLKSESKTSMEIKNDSSDNVNNVKEPVKRSLMDELKYKFSYLND